MLVRKAADGKAELVLLDHGLYENIPSSVCQALCCLLVAAIRNDHPAIKVHGSVLGLDGNVSPFDGKH